MDTSASRYDLRALCRSADVTPRTVHFYIQQGLLRPAGSPGPGARYDEGHLLRLRLIRRLQKEHLPLAEIRKRLDAIDDREVERLLKEADRTASRPRGDSALEYVRDVLRASASRSAAASPGAPPAGTARDPAALRGASLVSAGAPPAAPDRSQWDRIVLCPDIELHIRRPLSREQNRQVERLIKAARAVLEEESQ